LTTQAINPQLPKKSIKQIIIKKSVTPAVTPLTTKGKGHLGQFNQRNIRNKPWNSRLFPSEIDAIQQFAEDHKNLNRHLFKSLQQASITGTHILNKTVPSLFQQSTCNFLKGLIQVPSPQMEEYQEDIKNIATITSALMLKAVHKHHTARATALQEAITAQPTKLFQDLAMSSAKHPRYELAVEALESELKKVRTEIAKSENACDSGIATSMLKAKIHWPNNQQMGKIGANILPLLPPPSNPTPYCKDTKWYQTTVTKQPRVTPITLPSHREEDDFKTPRLIRTSTRVSGLIRPKTTTQQGSTRNPNIGTPKNISLY
jgi:hypothetical protein